MSTVLDHLVVAANSLDEGVRWCEATLGITPGPAGSHPLMGTHNRVFSVASDVFPNAYFEIIAIDPLAAPIGRARWFGLDTIDLVTGPRLIHWVARTSALDAHLAALRALDLDAGEAIAASRDTPSGRLQWRIAVRSDGRVLAGGALPTLIEWGARHPATSMPGSGVTLHSLTLRGLVPAAVESLGLQSIDRAAGPGPALTACLATPRGRVSLTSS